MTRDCMATRQSSAVARPATHPLATTTTGTTRARRRFPLASLVGTWIVATAHAAPPLSIEQQAELARSALEAFDRAAAASRDDPGRAMSLYRESAARFESLLESGVRSSALEYNLGNAYFRAGDLGRAILHYRRAQRLDPSRADTAANLDYARRRVEPLFSPSASSDLGDRLLFWNRTLSIQTRFRIAAVASLAGWALLCVWLWRRATYLAALGGVAVALGTANAASVAWQLRDETLRPHAVLCAANQVLRQGRGEGYDPVLSQPLGEGVEVRVLDTRGEWVEVRLVDGTRGWLPAASIERI